MKRKIDVLGLKTLSEIEMCMEFAGISRDWFDSEETDDQQVYKFLREGHTCNIFQMHKPLPTRMIRDFKVNSLELLTAINAADRPGPLAKGADGKSIVDKIIEATQTGYIPSLDPRIDYIFADTGGQMLYQEQLQELGRAMCGYSLGGSDIRIRKVVAKKKKKQIPEIRNEFIYGCQSIYNSDGIVTGKDINNPSKYCIGAKNNNFDEALAIKLFKDIENFSSYCFC